MILEDQISGFQAGHRCAANRTGGGPFATRPAQKFASAKFAGGIARRETRAVGAGGKLRRWRAH